MKKNPRLKIKDLQFARHFLLHEVDLSRDIVKQILELDVEVRLDGEADSVVVRNKQIIVSNPSSVTRFLFAVLYSALSDHVVDDAIYKDKLGLCLLHMCKEYVYSDFDLQPSNSIPVLVDFHKLTVPSFILTELVEPIVGKLEYHPVFFMPCRFTDVCRPIDSLNSLTSQYDLPNNAIGYGSFPVVVCNTQIHNSAAQLAHLTAVMLEMSVGSSDKCRSIIRNILLQKDFMDHVVQILKTLRGEMDFVVNFLDYLGSNALMSDLEHSQYRNQQAEAITADSFLSKNIKTASPSNNPQVWKQWSQWSMMMGLIEKQLSPMRGSMWPASEKIKPHEDQLRLIQRELAEKKGKPQLNFEELLETYRGLWGHKHHEPGKIIEHMLKDDRVWKS